MNLRSRVGLALQALKGNFGGTYGTTSGLVPRWMLDGQPSVAGPSVTPITAMQQSTVFTCTRIISETLGSITDAAQICEKKDNGDLIPIDHDLSHILFETPNADMNGLEYHEVEGANLALQGNAYSIIQRRGDKQVSSLYPVQGYPVRKPDGAIVYKIQERGKTVEYPKSEIFHVKGFGSDGLIGYSPVGYQRQLIGMALATEDWQARFFANGAMPSWLVSIPNWLSDKERERAKQKLMDIFAGGNNAYKPGLLEGGMTATSATMPLQDAQFLELSQKSRGDIFGYYRIPPHMGGDLQQSTNNNIEQQAIEFVMYCMIPYIKRMQEGIRWQLFSLDDRRKYVVQYRYTELFKADSVAQSEVDARHVQNGIKDRNEIRVGLGLARSTQAGMDDKTAQVNLAPVDLMRTIAQAVSAAPKSTPAPSPAPASDSTKDIDLPISIPIRVEVPAPIVQPVEVKVNPVINVEAPVVHLTVDVDPITKTLKYLETITQETRERMEDPTEIVRNDQGEVIGSRRVKTLKEKTS